MEGGQGNGRQKLLEAAAQCFSKEDYEAVPVSKLLAAAGVQAPTLYHHFHDKEGLFVEWARGAFMSLGQGITTATNARSHPLDELTAFAEVILRANQLDLLQTLRDSGKMTRPESKEQIFLAFVRSTHEPLCSIMVRAMQAGILSEEPIGRLASLFLMGTLSLTPRYGFESHQPEAAAKWWSQRFLDGFRRP
jgi:AcrR family transcriptional regulator